VMAEASDRLQQYLDNPSMAFHLCLGRQVPRFRSPPAGNAEVPSGAEAGPAGKRRRKR
jgi:hypothetical protein